MKNLLIAALLLFPTLSFAITGDETYTGNLDVRGTLIVNEDGSNDANNVRIEGDTDQNLVVVDSTNDRFGIRTSSPQVTMHVIGATRLDAAVTINEDGNATDTRIESDANANMLLVDGVNDRVGIGTAPVAGPFVVLGASTQTIGSGGTITADSCGGLKRITAAGNVTTDTTDTFSAPAGKTDCCMDVVNVSNTTITLDTNANFASAGAANVALAQFDSVRVCSDGVRWIQIGDTGNN